MDVVLYDMQRVGVTEGDDRDRVRWRQIAEFEEFIVLLLLTSAP